MKRVPTMIKWFYKSINVACVFIIVFYLVGVWVDYPEGFVKIASLVNSFVTTFLVAFFMVIVLSFMREQYETDCDHEK